MFENRKFELSEDGKILYRIKERYKTSENIVVPEGIKVIADYAFESCGQLLNIKLPSTLKQIGAFAFSNCISLRNIEIPEGVQEIENCTFYNCGDLESIKLPESLSSIDEFAFNSCHKLKSIFIPSRVDSISWRAFEGCLDLEKIIVDKDNPIYSDMGCNIIYDKMFDELIQGCKTSTIPESTERINDSAFSQIPIKSVIIPPNVKIIGTSAFANANINKLKLNEGLVSIQSNAFINALKDIKEVIIPNTVTEIGEWTFACNEQIEKIILSKNLKSLGEHIFAGDSNLKVIDFMNMQECIIETNIIDEEFKDNVKINVFNKQNLDKYFLDEYNKQITEITLDDLLNQYGSLNKINKLFKNNRNNIEK